MLSSSLQSTMISFVEGSLFSTNSDFSLAQCISSDAQYGMFRGISVQFLDHFPELIVLREMGEIALGAAIPVNVEGRFVYNLVTKIRYWSKPVPYNLFMTLKAMKSHASEYSVKNIAIPFLGSGLDKLNFFEVVFPLVREVFENTNIDIHVYCPKSFSSMNERLVIFI